MQTVAPLFLFCILLCGARSVPQQHITREQIIGNWVQYEILDNAKYLSIPDSMKGHDPLRYPVANFISNIYEFHKDGTYSWYAGLMDVEIGYDGTWSVRNDTIILTDSAAFHPQYLPVRVIASNKLELHASGLVDGTMEHEYWFLEKE